MQKDGGRGGGAIAIANSMSSVAGVACGVGVGVGGGCAVEVIRTRDTHILPMVLPYQLEQFVLLTTQVRLPGT